MAIGTYAELKTAVANWLDRDDLTDRIPEFIALAEAKMNRNLRISLKCNAHERRVTANAILLIDRRAALEAPRSRLHARDSLPESRACNPSGPAP